MKKVVTKKIISSLILSSILLAGCGSDDKDKDSGKQSVDAVLSKSEAAVGTPSGIDFNNKTSLRLKREQKVYKKIVSKMDGIVQKEELACSQSGTILYDKGEGDSFSALFSECIDYDADTKLYTYTDGSMMTTTDENGVLNITFSNYYEIPDYMNHADTGIYWHISLIASRDGDIETSLINGEMKSYKDGYYTEEEKFSKFTLKENSANKTLFLKGGYSYKGGCLDENHVYDTKESDWLVEDTKNSDNWTKGTLYVDNATYRYDGLNVIVEKQDKKGEFTQQELRDEIERKKKSTDCTT